MSEPPACLPRRGLLVNRQEAWMRVGYGGRRGPARRRGGQGRVRVRHGPEQDRQRGRDRRLPRGAARLQREQPTKRTRSGNAGAGSPLPAIPGDATNRRCDDGRELRPPNGIPRPPCPVASFVGMAGVLPGGGGRGRGAWMTKMWVLPQDGKFCKIPCRPKARTIHFSIFFMILLNIFYKPNTPESSRFLY